MTTGGPAPSVYGRVAELAAERERTGLIRSADPAARPVRIDLASNDYLGLSRDRQVVGAGRTALIRAGTGARASRVARGTHDEHADAERALTALTGQESALLLSSGYLANLAAVTALADADTLIVSDQHVHASLIDAARLARGTVAVFPHQDVDAATALLRDRTQPRAVLLVESVYSVLGDAAPLRELADACRAYDALLLVDEAHGIGVVGEGRGLVHESGLAGDPYVVVTATLSKALGAQGGAVLGPARLREHLVNTARPFIFDTGLAPVAAAAAGRAARLVAADPTLAAGVALVASRLCERLREHGRGIPALEAMRPSTGAVQSVPMPSAAVAAEVAARLVEDGIDVGCFRPPSVPDGISRLRLTARATLTDDQIDEAAARLAEHLRPHSLAECACPAGSNAEKLHDARSRPEQPDASGGADR
ncbi:8-amino-7-oxononanoate synthase [Luteipulveratus flavus]|uniref:8-amino-7-oxononanoate synthase n=1 Tax=Luteipulveratus flavus TaxID=3031728 RepID=A0ABT6C4M6_9MICO|nr:8-amino-7-oxononanoate synthase [Luteipulveratus sp. YIM 133296]MDF8263894.1 8-amino-7-oxononanoate synthase [Luteipulveratus sp. YIM 133296]